MVTFQLFFSVQGTGGSPTGQDPENRVGDQDSGSPGRPVSSVLQVPDECIVFIAGRLCMSASENTLYTFLCPYMTS